MDMLFNSYQFLLFFPFVTLVYFLIPNRIKYIWLLISSYYFYMCWNAKYALLMLFSTVITYVCSILIETVKHSQWVDSKKTKYKKLFLLLCISLNLLVLGYFKYSNFLLDLVSKLFGIFHISLVIPEFDIILPVGISFYTFQALGYTIDVYRDEIYAEKNFLRYALFVSFFPQLVAGPIERSKNLLKQLAVPKPFSFEGAKHGAYLMLWGFFLKVVLADRLALTVDAVYNTYKTQNGLMLAIATILFALQIYCDFYGYSVIAKGAAKILGIDLMENFESPYLSFSVAEFWRNWHISLTSWFKDYLYIPLGGSRKGKLRKYINKVVVFLVSGLWHGAGLSFVAWGFLNGIYQVIEELLRPAVTKVLGWMKTDEHNIFYKSIQLILTFVLVDFAWIFFRANGVRSALMIANRILCIDKACLTDMMSQLNAVGLDQRSIVLIAGCILVLLVADFCKKRRIFLSQKIMNLPWWVQSCLIVAFLCTILVFGVWGPGYNQANFIYFQF